MVCDGEICCGAARLFAKALTLLLLLQVKCAIPTTYRVPTEFEWLAASVENEQELCAKTLIFAHSINSVSEIYSWLMCHFVK